jgi:hypothetical protein
VSNDSDLDQLRERFPTWHIRVAWATAATGPDRRRIVATRDGITLSAFSIAALAQEIERAEVSE